MDWLMNDGMLFRFNRLQLEDVYCYYNYITQTGYSCTGEAWIEKT